MARAESRRGARRRRTARWALPALAALALSACSAADGTSNSGGASTSSSPAATSPAPSPSRSPESTEEERDERGEGRGEPRGDSPRAFSADIGPITPALEQRMRWSHRAGCPLALDDLRHLRLPYVGLDGVVRTGELVVHREVARDVVTVFRRMYAAPWPVARMRLVDAYRGDDDRSMAANNTSAYNCRTVSGGSSWSEHAYGRAIDINPVQNPYVQAGSVAPPAGRRYVDLDRSPGGDVPPGVLRAGDVVVRAFADVGWEWGGAWTSSKDYQHFSLSGR